MISDKIVEQFDIETPSNINESISAKITELPDGRFRWEISHHWQESKSGRVYYPSTVECDTLEEARDLCRQYARGFSNDSYLIVKNDGF